MNIYLDVCCLCRPFDDQSQERVQVESEAVKVIIYRCQRGVYTMAGSEAIEIELAGIANHAKLTEVIAVYSVYRNYLPMDVRVEKRSLELRLLGLDEFDSLHLALAETFSQDVLLTTDDDFIKKATRIKTNIPVKNPRAWLMEIENEHQFPYRSQ
jgi:predicted nucleic acid-binding protein